MRPFTTRLKPGPRWSLNGGGVKVGLPVLIAGLPANSAVSDSRHAATAVVDAAAVGGRVAANSRAADGQRSAVEHAAAKASSVAADYAIGNHQGVVILIVDAATGVTRVAIPDCEA